MAPRGTETNENIINHNILLSFSFTCNGHRGPEINENGRWSAVKYKWFGLSPAFWNHSLQILSGSWNVVKYNGLDSRQDSGITHCRFLWGLECCEIQWFGVSPAFWNHSLQILAGSWNAVKHNGVVAPILHVAGQPSKSIQKSMVEGTR